MNPLVDALTDKALSSVAALPGVVRVVLTSSDGLVYGQAAGGASSEALSADLLSAEITSVTMALGRVLTGLSGGLSSQKLHRYSFASEQHEFLALNLGRVLLLVAVQTGAALRPVQVEMARVATAMSAELANLEGAA